MKKQEAAHIESEVNDKTQEAEKLANDPAIINSGSSPSSNKDVPATSSDTSTSSSGSASQTDNGTSDPGAALKSAKVSETSDTPEATPSENAAPKTSGGDASNETVSAANSETKDAKDTSAGDNPDTGPKGIMGFIKKQPLIVIGGAGLAIWGLTKLLGGKKSPNKGLSGVRHKHKPKKAKKKRGRPKRRPMSIRLT
jgi:hypothetical protein